MAPFVHLHVHSDYSFGKGSSKIKDLVARAKELGMPALALTDFSNMHGALQFSKEAAGAGIQPIIGAKVFVDAPLPKGQRVAGSLQLLAQSEIGYRNLCTIVETAWLPQARSDGSEA